MHSVACAQLLASPLAAMGRSGGSNKGATPDWLKTAEEREGPSLNRREQRAAEKA